MSLGKFRVLFVVSQACTYNQSERLDREAEGQHFMYLKDTFAYCAYIQAELQLFLSLIR